MSGKIDRRVKYTKMVLKDALIKLLQEKQIEKITIKELCEEADINRGTFYMHYTDQYDLIKQIIEKLIIDINCYLERYASCKDERDAYLLLVGIFKYIRENDELARMLLSDNCNIDFQRKTAEVLKQSKIFEIDQEVTQSNRDSLNYIYAYISAGCLGLVREWINTNMEKSEEEIARTAMILTGQGLQALGYSRVILSSVG